MVREVSLCGIEDFVHSEGYSRIGVQEIEQKTNQILISRSSYLRPIATRKSQEICRRAGD